MQGFYDPQARHTEIDVNRHDDDENFSTIDRRGHPDRRRKERRNSKASKSAAFGPMQPILTQAEIAVLLRGAR